MLELLGKQHRYAPHTRADRAVLRSVGRDVAAPAAEVVAGLGECVRLFTESGDEDASAMALAARATARLHLPDPDVTPAVSN